MKFRPLAIYLIGLSLFIAAVAFSYFLYYMPNKEEAADYAAYKDQLQGVIDKKSQAIKRKKNAAELVRASNSQWESIVQTRTPATTVAAGGIDLGVTAWQLPVDARVYRNNLQRLVNHQLQVGGVKLPNGGPMIDSFGDSQTAVLAGLNYPVYAFPITVVEIPNVTVEGTYEQILRNYRGWASVPRYIALPDGLQLTGTSPVLRGTYNVIMLGYIRAKDIFPPQPDAILAGGGAATGFSGAAAGGGGFPPNLPGVPGGGAPGGGSPGSVSGGPRRLMSRGGG